MNQILKIIIFVIPFSFSLLLIYYAIKIQTYGSIQIYRKLRKNYNSLKKSLTIKRRKCIFCGYPLRFSYFFWINAKDFPKDILIKWNSPENTFYCSDCYMKLNLEDELNTSYLGFYKIKKYIS